MPAAEAEGGSVLTSLRSRRARNRSSSRPQGFRGRSRRPRGSRGRGPPAWPSPCKLTDVHGQGLAVWLQYAVYANQGSPALGIADPHGGTQSRRVADVSGVGEVVRGPRLAGGGTSYFLVEVVEHDRRPVLYHAPQDLVRDRGLIAREHAFSADFVVVDRLDMT